MDEFSALDITLVAQADIPKFKPTNKPKSTRYSILWSSEAGGVRTDFRFVATPGVSHTSATRGLEGWSIDGLTERTSLKSRKVISSRAKLFAIMTGVDGEDITGIAHKL